MRAIVLPCSIVVIDARGNLRHEIRFLVPGKPKGGKAPGTAYYALHYKLGSTPPAGIVDCVRGDKYSKRRGVVTFAEADASKTVWYIAVPVNSKGQGGPASEAVAATIAA